MTPFFKNDFITVFQDSQDKYRVFMNGTTIMFNYSKSQVQELMGAV